MIQWLRDNLELISNAKEVNELAEAVEDNGGVYFVPAFSGLYDDYLTIVIHASCLTSAQPAHVYGSAISV